LAFSADCGRMTVVANMTKPKTRSQSAAPDIQMATRFAAAIRLDT
jgi:hypothetical protein